MHLPAEFSTLRHSHSRRDAQQDSASRSRIIFLSVSAGSLIFLAIVLLSYTFFVRRRMGRKLIPSRKSWQLGYWRKRSYGQLSTRDRSQSLTASNTAYNAASSTDRTNREDESAAHSAVEAGVDRNTSVRSVMTLPAYSPAPKESEQVIGREGERAGMDTVVEFPETVDEEEARRDGEMESLYQIRLARRREAAERDLRRHERREARERGDWARLEELRLQSRSRADSANAGSNTDPSAANLLSEYQSRGRDQRVSSVSYADVGHVRHDGSRLRANSQESERGGLLDGAAPIGETQGHHRAGSGSSSFFSILTRSRPRKRSNSSLSISTAASEVDNGQHSQMTPPSAHDGVRRSSGGRRSPHGNEFTDNGTSESSPATQQLTPEVSSGSDDIGDSHIPPPGEPSSSHGTQLPGYDTAWGEVPAYHSSTHEGGITAASSVGNEPVELHGDSIPSDRDGASAVVSSNTPRLPPIQTLPSINVEGATEPNTPSSPVRRSVNYTGP